MPLDYCFTGFEINKIAFEIYLKGNWKVRPPALVKQIIMTEELINGEPAIYYRLEHQPELVRATNLFETGDMALLECVERNKTK